MAKLPTHMENWGEGVKLISPSSVRNHVVIGEVLQPYLTKHAHVLEVASGTGQHGAHMCECRPDIRWQMSDIDLRSRQSQNAYATDHQAQISPSLMLDVTQPKWWESVSGIDVIYCANMIHIAPWEAALGLAEGAGKLLKQGGVLCLYGPFLTKSSSAPSNIEFDKNLKARNPLWGVRNLEAVKHIFADRGLNFHSGTNMPRDNMFLVFKTIT